VVSYPPDTPDRLRALGYEPLVDFEATAAGDVVTITRWSHADPQPTPGRLAELGAAEIEAAAAERSTRAALGQLGSGEPVPAAVRAAVRAIYLDLNEVRAACGLPERDEAYVLATIAALIEGAS
jgi:hypothetical protein